MLYIDLHTHKITPSKALFVLNSRFGHSSEQIDAHKQESFKKQCRALYSHGLHPWDASELNCRPQTWQEIEKVCSHDEVIFIGESGFDQIKKENWNWQEAAFLNQISLSENLRKPMIIHNVRAGQKILEMRKKSRAQMPWILHDFNGNEQMIDMFKDGHFFFSLGTNFMRSQSKIISNIDHIPREKLLFETDENTFTIEKVYEKYEFLSGIDTEQLQAKIIQNTMSLIGSKYLPFLTEAHLP